MEKESFEENIKELEDIVKELEEGNLDLEKAVEKFEKGMKISKKCNDMLDDAEKKISILLEKDEEIEETKFEE